MSAEFGERAELAGVEGDVFVAFFEEGFVELFDFLLGLGDARRGYGDVFRLREDLGGSNRVGRGWFSGSVTLIASPWIRARC